MYDNKKINNHIFDKLSSVNQRRFGHKIMLHTNNNAHKFLINISISYKQICE